MNPDLSRSFKDIFHGLLYAQFNVEVRSARFKDVLISTLAEFLFLIVAALFVGDRSLTIILAFGLIFTALEFLYHVKTDVNRVDLKAIFFIVIYTGLFLPAIFYHCGGAMTIGPAFLQTQMYFVTFFILKTFPAAILAVWETGAWLVLMKYNDKFIDVGINQISDYNFDIFFIIAGYLMSVITIGSLIAKTIGAYDKEQAKAKDLFDDYNKQLYKSGTGNAYNDRFLLTNVGTLGVLTEKGDIPGFTAVAFSVDNEELISHLTNTADKETFDVFTRKVQHVIAEDEIFVRQEENKFVLLLNTVSNYEIEEKLDELIAIVNMTIFEHLPKDRLTISVGYAVHKSGMSTVDTMQRATENMLIAKKKGGNMRVGGAF